MAKKSGMYKSTSGPGPTVIPTGGTGTGGTIPTGLDPTGPKPIVGGPTVGTGDPFRPYGGPGPTGTTQPVDYTGNIGQYGSYGPSMTNVFGAPGSSATKIIYRDVMVNQGGAPDQVANVQSGTEAANMQNLAGSQSDQARQEVLKRMGNNMAGNASFDPRRPQTGGLFGVAFSKTTDSKTAF